MKRILFFLCFVTFITACDKNTIADQQDTSLPGFWRYQSGVPFDLWNPLDGENPIAFIKLDEVDGVSGNTSRNVFEGKYTADEAGAFGIEILSMTLGPDTEWSGHFTDMLSSVDQYTIEANELTLIKSENNADYIFIKLNDETCVPVENNRDRFQNAQTDEFRLVEVNVFETCLEVRIEYGGGCKGIDVEMVGSGDYAESLPPQLAVRFIVDDDDHCEALVHENFYFDLTALQYDGLDELLLNIEGMNDLVLVRY
jgi:heat shock protein HslJ